MKKEQVTFCIRQDMFSLAFFWHSSDSMLNEIRLNILDTSIELLTWLQIILYLKKNVIEPIVLAFHVSYPFSHRWIEDLKHHERLDDAICHLLLLNASKVPSRNRWRRSVRSVSNSFIVVTSEKKACSFGRILAMVKSNWLSNECSSTRRSNRNESIECNGNLLHRSSFSAICSPTAADMVRVGVFAIANLNLQKRNWSTTRRCS